MTRRVSLFIFAGLLALAPAFAGEVPFNGHTLTVAEGADAGRIERMLSAQYNIPGTGAEIIARAQTCAAGVAGVTLESASPESGELVLRASVDYRAGFSARTLRSRLDLASADAAFRIAATELTVQQGSGDDAASAPLAQSDSGWEKGLEALLGLENKLVDCLYR